jgi:multicomponent Na+:H+ antiporter subunit E
MRRYVPYAIGLAVAWVMLWDQITIANFLGGLAVAVVLLAVFPLPRVDRERRMTVRPVALARLGAAVVGELFVSNVFMTREILTPRRRLASGVVRCPMRTSSPQVMSAVANILALSPGTMAVDATHGPPTLFVHVLVEGPVDLVRRQVAHLERLVVEAIGSVDDRRALQGPAGMRASERERANGHKRPAWPGNAEDGAR